MSLDLFQDQNERALSEMPVTTEIEPGVWDGFLSGSGKIAMRTFAEAGRAASMAVAAGPVIYDAAVGGTEMQEKYFKFHDEITGNAVDSWTPKPGDVGTAGEVVGTLLGTLPLVIASPSLAVAKTQLTAAEDLTRMGVESTKAQAVAGVQALGFGLGVWLPILGGNFATRTLVGGAAANVALGVAERAVSEEILEGTPAEGMYQAFDPKMMTLDVMLGLAFGTLAHLSPAQRAQGDAFWKSMREWGKKIEPSDVEALAVLRQAQHMDADSLPGRPVDIEDIGNHSARMRQAIDQLLRDEPVRVEGLPEARVEPDELRISESEARLNDMQSEAKRIQKDEGIINVQKMKAEPAEPIVAKADPLTDAATRFAEEHADLKIPIGKNAEGEDITVSAKQLLDDADTGIKAANENARLFKTAASCLMGLI